MLRGEDPPDTALEQGWLLRTLHEDHGVPMEQLARRFDRSVSWVSRRLSLVRNLPDGVQRRVQEGRIVAHAAMKYLVPLARANAPACLRLVEAIAVRPLSTRQVGRLYQACLTGTAAVRELVVTAPLLVLRLDEEAQRARGDLPIEPAGADAFLSDLPVVAAVARRATRRLRAGLALQPPDRERAWRACCQAQTDVEDLHRRCGQELSDARSMKSIFLKNRKSTARKAPSAIRTATMASAVRGINYFCRAVLRKKLVTFGSTYSRHMKRLPGERRWRRGRDACAPQARG